MYPPKVSKSLNIDTLSFKPSLTDKTVVTCVARDHFWFFSPKYPSNSDSGDTLPDFDESGELLSLSLFFPFMMNRFGGRFASGMKQELAVCDSPAWFGSSGLGDSPAWFGSGGGWFTTLALIALISVSQSLYLSLA
jgi:hypothetical protein